MGVRKIGETLQTHRFPFGFPLKLAIKRTHPDTVRLPFCELPCFVSPSTNLACRSVQEQAAFFEATLSFFSFFGGASPTAQQLQWMKPYYCLIDRVLFFLPPQRLETKRQECEDQPKMWSMAHLGGTLEGRSISPRESADSPICPPNLRGVLTFLHKTLDTQDAPSKPRSLPTNCPMSFWGTPAQEPLRSWWIIPGSSSGGNSCRSLEIGERIFRWMSPFFQPSCCGT